MGGLAAFILLDIICVFQTLQVPKCTNVAQAGVGDTVTLTCDVSEHKKGLFYWYKLIYGRMIQTVVKGSFGRVQFEGEFKNSRFSITLVDEVYSLTIGQLSQEDEAAYFCQAGAAYSLDFINVTSLMLNHNDFRKHPKSLFIIQSSDIKSEQMRDLVTLQCSVLSETQNNSYPCSGRRCAHGLSKTTQNTETYYCAEAVFGETLFGEQTKLETGIIRDHVIIGLGVLLALCVVVIAVLIIARE